MHELASHFAGCGTGSSWPPVWTTITGPSGTGKTTIIRYLFANALNCDFLIISVRDCSTLLGLLNAILYTMGLPEVKNTNGGVDAAIKTVQKAIEKRLNPASKRAPQVFQLRQEERRYFVLALDDFTTIMPGSQNHHTSLSEIVNKLYGMFERLQQKQIPAGLIVIMNDIDETKLDEAIRSRIGARVISFPRYSKEELIDILTGRAKEALLRTLNFEVIRECAIIAANETGSARMAIDLLRETVELAALLDISQDSVNASHVRKTRSKSLFGSADNESLDMIDRLHPQQRILLGIIIWMAMLDHKAVKGSEILEEYGNYFDRVGPVNGLRKLQPRRVHTYLEELVEKSILGKVKTSGGRSQGIDNIYSLKMDPYKLGPHILASQWQCFLSAKESLADISFRREILKAGPPESWLACSPILDVEENKFRDRLIIRSAIS